MSARIYLAGPINGCSDAECKDWRSEAKGRLHPLSFLTRDPMDRDFRGREHLPGIAEEIVAGDKLDIEISDVVLVMYDKPSVGTSMEVYHAWAHGKPVVVVADRVAHLSPWLTYHSSAVVPTLGDAVAWLEEEFS